MNFAGVKNLLTILSLSVALAGAIAPHHARAWDPSEVHVGKVAFIQFGEAGSVGFVLEGVSALCQNASSPAWGDIGASAPGKKEMVAALMMAKASGMSVRVYSRTPPVDGGAIVCPVAFIDLF